MLLQCFVVGVFVFVDCLATISLHWIPNDAIHLCNDCRQSLKMRIVKQLLCIYFMYLLFFFLPIPMYLRMGICCLSLFNCYGPNDKNNFNWPQLKRQYLIVLLFFFIRNHIISRTTIRKKKTFVKCRSWRPGWAHDKKYKCFWNFWKITPKSAVKQLTNCSGVISEHITNV